MCCQVCSSGKEKPSRKRNPNEDSKAAAKTRKRIDGATIKFVYDRGADAHVSHICKSINISSPTFYSYYRSLNDAIESIERNLEEQFVEILPEKCTREMAFTLYLSHIYERRHYFKPALNALDIYVLMQLIGHMRPLIVGNDVSQKSFSQYAMALGVIVIDWALEDDLAKDRIGYRVKELMKIRLQYNP